LARSPKGFAEKGAKKTDSELGRKEANDAHTTKGKKKIKHQKTGSKREKRNMGGGEDWAKDN